jgi:hypothetical protein
MNLHESLQQYSEKIAESYIQNITHLFQKVVDKHGPTLKGVYSCWSYAKVFTKTLKYLVKSTLIDSAKPYAMDNRTYTLDEVLVKNAAEAYAVETVAAWEKKIQSKLVDLKDAEVKYFTGLRFDISGAVKNKKVVIHQDMILNVSKLGTLFNQFPARIYVGGKFMSEASYKRMLAGV